MGYVRDKAHCTDGHTCAVWFRIVECISDLPIDKGPNGKNAGMYAHHMEEACHTVVHRALLSSGMEPASERGHSILD